MTEPTHHIDDNDAIVIGGGLAGLCAASRLAQDGHRVLLIERRSELGGRARTDDLDGWLFNLGGHALYRNGVGHRALRSLGVDPAGAAPPLAGGRVMIGGRTTPLPIDARGVLRSTALSMRSKPQFAKLMAGLPRLDARRFANTTVDEWIAGLRPDTAAVVHALVRLSTYAASPEVMSAEAAILQLRGATDGVLYLHGGWATMCSQLAQTATNAGADIATGVAVTAVRPDSTGFIVETEGSTHRATTVIVAAGGPDFTARLLRVNRKTFGPTGPACEAAVLDLALDAMPTRHRFVLGVDEPTYFSVHSPPARLAPEGKVAAVAMRYLRPDDNGADEHRRSLQRIAALAGAGTPVRERFLARVTVTNGLPLAAQGGLTGRPPVEVPSYGGVFVAGDWVGPSGMLADAAISSGVAAAEAAATRLSDLADPDHATGKTATAVSSAATAATPARSTAVPVVR